MTKLRIKKPTLGRRAAKAFRGHSRGFTLIEVTIAIALLGIIAVAILAALSTASMALIIADTRATAESLARSQMEYVKNQAYHEEYIDYSEPDHEEYKKIEGYAGNYNLETTVEPIDPTDNKPYPYLEGDGCFQQDVGIQRITVTVSYHTVGAQNREVERQFTLEDYLRRPVA
jgi:prepilin-type N-terminal cleavage/methylation domain-containing protein